MTATAPVVLAPNLPETFYAGSGRLPVFRRADVPDRPEEWIASTTRRFGQREAGLSLLPDGTTLLDAITADPVAWLGSHDPDTGLLVKLLDAGQRLPLHVHPDRAFAHAHLSSPYGKTEAWIVIDAAPGAVVNLGFSRDVDADELAGWVRRQDVAAMLAATNEVPIRAGDAVLCPAGTPHAIGADVLLVELQEPTDFSIMLETAGFPIPADDAMLGLAPDLALGCVNRGAVSPQQIDRWRTAGPSGLLPSEADAYFRAQQVTDGAVLRGFGVLIVTDGAGTLAGEWGVTAVPRGSVLVLPYAAGAVQLSGDVSAVLCLPPERLPPAS
jgi:mannose-6-phosphate isomerase